MVIARWINTLASFYILIVIIHSVLSFILGPYHPIRRFFDILVEPVLNPIRRIVPLIGGIDFSPMVLIVLVLIISSILVNTLNALAR